MDYPHGGCDREQWRTYRRRQHTPLTRVVWHLALVVSAAISCQQRSSADAAEQEKLVVYAAASLREAFNGLSEEFRSTRPGVTVTFNFAGSQELRTQLEHGAPADVFASADERNMTMLEQTGLVKQSQIFAENELVVVVSREKASTIRTFAQLPLAERLVLGALDVPVGMYSLQVLERAAHRWGAEFATRVQARVVSRELNVRQVLAKVLLGEADAGIVYRTDIIGKGSAVAVVDIPAEFNVTAGYPIARLRDAAHPKLAGEWISLVQSTRGRRVLENDGFRLPHEEVTH